MSDARWFPLQHQHSPHGERFRVPWRIAEKAFCVYAKSYHGQTLETIAARGGFCIEELIYLLAGEDPSTARDEGPLQSDFFNRFPVEQRKQESR